MRLACVMLLAAAAAGAADTGTVSGTVTDADTGKRLADVRVELLVVEFGRLAPAQALGLGCVATTDKRGRFQLNDVPPGQWYVGVRDARMAPASEDLAATVEPGKNVKKLKLAAREGFSIEGNVWADVDFSEGVAGVVVECLFGDDDAMARAFRGATDATGHYRIGGLPAGAYQVELAPGQRYSMCSPVFVADEVARFAPHMVTVQGPVTNVEFQVKGAFAVTGVVVDVTGKPVAGAEVGRLFTSDYDPKSFRPLAQTDDQGRFTLLSLEEQTGHINARKGDLLSRDTPYKAALKPADSEPCTLRLAKPGRISGRVVDKAGNPLKQVALWMDCRTSDAYSSAFDLNPDKDGRFTASGLFPGTYSVRVTDMHNAYGFNTVEGPTVELGEEQVIEDYEIVVDAVAVEPQTVEESTVSGRVTGPDGAPVANARIGAYLNNQQLDMVRSGDDGSYTIHTSLTGDAKDQSRLLLVTVAPGFNRGYLREVVPGSTQNEIVLEQAPMLTLRAVDDVTGKAVGQYALNMQAVLGPDEAAFPREHVAKKISNDTGEYQARLTAGTWVFTLKADGYLPQQQELSLNAGQETVDVEVRLHKPARVEGVVLKPDGAPLQGAHIIMLPLIRPGSHTPGASTDAQGKFTLEGLTPGTPVLQVSHADYSDKSVDVDLIAGKTRVVEIRLAKRGGLTGRVTFDGEPVLAQVAWRDSRGWNQAATDDDGRYSFDNFTADDVSLDVSFQRLGETRYLSRQIRRNGVGTPMADFDFMPAKSRLTGTLLVNGEPAFGNIFMRVYYPSGETETINRATLEDGTYSLGVPHGRAAVQFRTKPLAACYHVELPDNGVLELDAELTAGVTVSGVVKGTLDPDSSWVRIISGTVTREEVDIDPVTSLDPRYISGGRINKGAFTINDISPGTYTAILARRGEAGETTAGQILDIKPFEVGAEPLSGIELVVAEP